MQTLGQDALGRAPRLVGATARPLDGARCALFLDGGGGATVLLAPARCQNANGGIGRATAADFHLGASSMLPTAVARPCAVAVGADAGQPVGAQGQGSLVAAGDEGVGLRRTVSLAVSHTQRAPCRHVEQATRRYGVEGTWASPSREVVGYLWPVGANVPEACLDVAIERQGEDGGGHRNWRWAESDGAARRGAEAAWAGVITVQTLRSLKAFGRLG